MKKIFVSYLILLVYSCSGNSGNTSTHDSANAIEDHPLQDTTVDTIPNGYTPPNDSAHTGDSVKH